MNRVFILFILLFTIGCKMKDTAPVEEHTFQLCLGCGYDGDLPQEYLQVKKYYKSKDTLALINIFQTKMYGEKFLAACYLDRWEIQDSYSNNFTINTELELYKLSNDTIISSRGCTDHRRTTIRKFFLYPDDVNHETIRFFLDSR